MSTSRDLSVVKGDSLDIVFSAVNPNGVVFNITGFNVYFKSGNISKNSFDPTQIEITDAVQGKGIVHLLSNDTNSFVSSQRYSLWIERTNGDHFTLLCGRIKFKCPI
jgi:hypothetical protein